MPSSKEVFTGKKEKRGKRKVIYEILNDSG
jgi:hypothetical protein